MKLVPDEFTGRHYGKYEVLCRVAVGGMAEIFLGFARSGPFMNRPVVLKNILPEQREDPVALQMLLDEARVTATLSHANIAQVVDLEQAGEDVLMVIEFIQGANLEEVVEAWTKQSEPVPLGYALTVVREAAQGLAHAHLNKDARGAVQPIVHRDVTPRNIMTGFDGGTKVLDFGIARAMGAQRRTVAGMVRGTTAYMSPEQAIGKDLDPRSDLFSIGVIFHELLTGQRLFFRGNPGAEMAAVYESEIPLPSKVNRRVPRALDQVVMRALERNRDKRYQSALELIRDLQLAAGSTAWSKERCAEMVTERFTDRLRAMKVLLERVPKPLGSTDQHLARGDENRTVMVPRPLADSQPEPSFKTLMEVGPEIAELRERAKRLRDGRTTSPGIDGNELGHEQSTTGESEVVSPPPAPPARPPPPPLEARRSANKPDSGPSLRPVTPVAQRAPPPPSKSRLLDQEDAAGLGEAPDRTKITGQRTIPRATTDPEREAVERTAERSSLPAVLAVILALVLGAAGAVAYMRYTRPQGLGRLTLVSDKPVTVDFQGQTLGATPLDAWVPAGQLHLKLKSPDGAVRELIVDVAAGEVVTETVALDSLQKLP